MIPDVLISKYLDGDLSLEEDVEFRAMLAADPNAREAFDSAVLLHIAMRCEDVTTVPSDVEESVLAFIANAPLTVCAQDQSMRSSSFRGLHSNSQRGGLSAYTDTDLLSFGRGLKTRGAAHAAPVVRSGVRRVMAAAAMLLVLALPFGDQFLGVGDFLALNYGSQPSKSSVQSTGNADLVSIKAGKVLASEFRRVANEFRRVASEFRHAGNEIDHNISSTEIERIVPSFADQLVQRTGFESLDLDANGTTSNTSIETAVGNSAEDRSATPSLHSLFSSNDLVSAKNQRDGESQNTFFGPDVPNIEMLVTTSYSQSVTAPTKGAVTTISAGFGYGVTTNTFVGMEMGSTQYTSTTEILALVREPAVSSVGVVPTRAAFDADRMTSFSKVTHESPNESSKSNYRTEALTSFSSEGTVWGAAFIQHSVLKTGIVSLNGRLGAGVGEDGMLTYGRMQAECNIVAGVSLTVGAEARYSPFRTGVIGGQPMARTYGTVISALYGLQVRL